jgi:hypothetical protein
MIDVRARAIRVRHVQGERLQARDIQDEYDNLSWLRSLHVVALHDTWGIALGFEVESGGDGRVLVGPGVAYDAFGREIVLSASIAVPGPRAVAPLDPATRYELVVAHDAHLGHHQHGAAPDAFVRERPAVRWRRAGETVLGREVALCAAILPAGGGAADQQLDLSVRRYAQALNRPHIASGQTLPGQRWTYWRGLDRRTVVGLETWVDTTEAGFVGRPTYIASLQGGAAASPISNAAEALAVPLITTHVARTDASGFLLRLAWASTGGDLLRDYLQGLLKTGRLKELTPTTGDRLTLLPWPIAWLGVEPAAGCPPEPRFAELRRAIQEQEDRRASVTGIPVDLPGPGA